MESGNDSVIAGRPSGGFEYTCLQFREGGSGIGIAPGEIGKVIPVPVQRKDGGQVVFLPRNPAVVLTVHGGAAGVGIPEGEGRLHIFFAQVGEGRTSERNQPERGIETGHPGTILLVDDDPVIIGLLGVMLAKLGYAVLSAGDGLDALEVFHEHQEAVDLVMTDVYMPRMNGWDTLEAVRQVAPDMPVILFSGCSEDQVMKEPHAEAPQAFLKKPFGFELLRDTIHRVMTDTR